MLIQNKRLTFKHITLISVILIASFFLNSFVEAADLDDTQFWKLYELAESCRNEGNISGAVNAWYSIIQLYNGDYSEKSNTRRAVYWTEIAKAYEKMEFYQNASEAYGEAGRNWEALGFNESALWPLKYEQLYRTEIDLYTKTSDTSISTGSREPAKFEPESGAYLGGIFVSDPLIDYNMNRIENIYGRKHNLLVYFCVLQVK